MNLENVPTTLKWPDSVVRHTTMAELCDCLCPTLDEGNFCIVCNREWQQCPTCLELHTTDDSANDCFKSHRTVLDDIADATL